MNKYSHFFEDLDNSVSASNSKSDGFFSDLPEEESPFISKVKKGARIGGQFALGRAEQHLFPYELSAQGMLSRETKTLERRQDIAEELEKLGSKRRQGTITPEENTELENLIS